MTSLHENLAEIRRHAESEVYPGAPTQPRIDISYLLGVVAEQQDIIRDFLKSSTIDTDDSEECLLRTTLDEVKRSHAEITQVRKLAEFWITDSMHLLATERKSGLNEEEMTVLARTLASCGRTVLAQLRPANAYTESDEQ